MIHSCSGLWQNSVPSWEKRFCTSVGIPWGKKLSTMQRDAFGQRSMVSPAASLRPDPDIYIDNIDWNPYIDPELMRNLDKEFFAPDEREQDCKLGGSNQKTNCPLPGHTAEGYDRNSASGDNPWELNMPKTLEDRAWAWDKWGGCKTELRNLDKTNSQVSGYATEGHYRKPDGGDSPWEYWNVQGVLKEKARVRNHSCNQANAAQRDNACGGWSQGWNYQNKSRNLDTVDDPWNVAVRALNLWGLNKGETWGIILGEGTIGTTVFISKKMYLIVTVLGNTVPFRVRKLQRIEVIVETSHRVGNSGRIIIMSQKKLESRKVSGGWGVWNGGCRKREGSHKNTSSYKCLRVQGDSYQTGHWGRKEEQRRGSIFSME
ncbi:hypothetical protein CK203_024677 [Vitis vinifera]|uniref:Uncharacterized protein n=1 Tax=Vitis vinifera TaxID=29760 RepID=A0A438IUU4_VITVI|nr:hypothetical protein CK203_024677 [Vitis vinifera]